MLGKPVLVSKRQVQVIITKYYNVASLQRCLYLIIIIGMIFLEFRFIAHIFIAQYVSLNRSQATERTIDKSIYGCLRSENGRRGSGWRHVYQTSYDRRSVQHYYYSQLRLRRGHDQLITISNKYRHFTLLLHGSPLQKNISFASIRDIIN